MAKDVFSTELCDFNVLRDVLGAVAGCKAFLVWRAYPREGGGLDKVPVDPNTGRTTAPNKPRDRGILTLDEAEAAWRVLRDRGIDGIGVGVFPPHTDGKLICGDVDAAVGADGAIAPWAAKITSGVYREISPSGTGLRFFISTAGEELDAGANGVERAGAGLYGVTTNRFTTITGHALGNVREILPLPEEGRQALWDRWATAPRPSMSAMIGLYPQGQEGADLAREDILTGAAFHPAVFAYYARSLHLGKSTSVIEQELTEAFENSAQKGTARWHARFPRSIEGASEWFWKQYKKKGCQSGINMMVEMGEDELERLRAKARRLEAERLERLRVKAAPVEQPRGPETAPDGGEAGPDPDHRLAPLFGSSWGSPTAEQIQTIEAMERDDPAALVAYARGVRPKKILEAPEITKIEDQLMKRAQPSAGPRKPLVSGADVMAHDPGDVAWIIDECVGPGLTLFVGTMKTGKSFLLMQMAEAVTSGTDFFGKRAKESRVLYYAIEDGKDRIARRARGIGLDANLALLDFRFEGGKDPDDLCSMIREDVAAKPDTRLIIIDTFKLSSGSRKKSDSNAYEQDVEMLRPFKSLAEETGIAILGTFHERKPPSGRSAGGDPYNRISGSAGLAATADGFIHLTRERGQHLAELYISGRDVRDETNLKIIQSRSDNGRFGLATEAAGLAMEASKHMRKSAGKTILQILLGVPKNSMPRKLLRDEVRDRHGITAEAFRQAVNRLAEGGDLEVCQKTDTIRLPDPEEMLK